MAAKRLPFSSEKANLFQVSEEFTQWRGRRTQGRSKIPAHLRHQAISLLSGHPKSRVTRALGITCDMLNRWQNHQPTEDDGQRPVFDSNLETLAFLQERLTDKDITLHKMRKLLGIVKSSEKLRDLAGKLEVAERVDSLAGQKSPQHLRKKAPVVVPEVIHHKLETPQKGDSCPACERGKVYKFEPARLLRITGNSPFTPEQHLSERVSCNAYGGFFTAPAADICPGGRRD